MKLFVVEDNAYAQSTASHQTFAGSYQARAAALASFSSTTLMPSASLR